jgi:hypothetical protein
MQSIIDRRERNMLADRHHLGVKQLSGNVTIAVSEKKLGQGLALPRGPEASLTKKL